MNMDMDSGKLSKISEYPGAFPNIEGHVWLQIC